MSETSDSAILIAQIKDKLGIGEDKVYAVMGEFAEPDREPDRLLFTSVF